MSHIMETLSRKIFFCTVCLDTLYTSLKRMIFKNNFNNQSSFLYIFFDDFFMRATEKKSSLKW